MIQKFSLEGAEDDDPVLCERTNVVVISDEAHRSQYGKKAKLVNVKDKSSKQVIGKKYVYGFAKHMRMNGQDEAVLLKLRGGALGN